jgi:ATPase family associated with various cellular activities (AAA)
MAPQTLTQDPRRELEMLLASRFALIVIESREEQRVLTMINDAGTRAGRGRNWYVFQWTCTDGLKRTDVDLPPLKTLAEPAALLRHLRVTPVPGIYVLIDFHPYLNDPVNVRMIKDVAQNYDKTPITLVLLSHEVTVPQELEHLTARLKLGMPTRNERAMVVTRIAQEWQDRNRRPVKIDPQALDHLIDNLSGLESPDTERLARQAIYNDGAVTMEDIPDVLAAKYQLLNRNGTLSYEPDTAKFVDVGGLAHLRQWLISRKPAFDGSAPELDAPKGMMLLGVQGCGKSLCARAAAGILNVPLLRLDFGSLYSKWHGESEKNMRDSLRAAEGLSPCVLWVDEIEKALAGSGDSDGGVSRRVLGTFLTWLAEQRSRIFVVATANDITSLPPELVRKGRFDEIFFVDLPTHAARADILAIHARRRNVTLSPQESQALADRSEGFSGAELEQAIVAALYTSHSTKQPMCAALIAHELKATQPLSVVMGEQIAALRAWAKDRTVPAD